jgi:hypothetical protein
MKFYNSAAAPNAARFVKCRLDRISLLGFPNMFLAFHERVAGTPIVFIPSHSIVSKRHEGFYIVVLDSRTAGTSLVTML